MYYVGLDGHQRMSSICVLDYRGNKVRERVIKGHWGKVIGALNRHFPDGAADHVCGAPRFPLPRFRTSVSPLN